MPKLPMMNKHWRNHLKEYVTYKYESVRELFYYSCVASTLTNNDLPFFSNAIKNIIIDLFKMIV